MKAEIIDKKSGSRRHTEETQNVSLDRPSVIFLKVAPENVGRYERRGDDLVLVLKDGQEITIHGFFVKYPDADTAEHAPTDAEHASTHAAHAPTDASPADDGSARNDLVLEDGNGVTWWGQYPEQWTEFHFTEIEWHDAGVVWWPWLLGALGAGAIGALAAGSGGGGHDTPNHPPVAAGDKASGNEDGGPVIGSVLANDSDVDGGKLSVTQFVIDGKTYSAGDQATIVGVGAITIGSDGHYAFTPDANWNGNVPVVTYTVSDGKGGTDTADLVITVNPVADLTAKDDTASTDEDTPFTGSVADNDSTTSGGDLTFAKESDPGHGTVVVNSDGSYTYTPDANYNGPDSFTYTVTDPASGESSTQTVNITVNPVVDLTAGDDTASTDEDTPFTGSVADNDSTTSGGDLTFAKESDPGHGTVVVNSDGSYTYTPDANYNGPDSFTYTVTDPASGESSTQTVNITVNPVADLTAADDTANTDEDTPFTGSVADNDSTTSGGDLTFAKESDPGHGTVIVNSDGSYTYTPDANYNGPDSFTYTVTDPASGESSTQTVNIIVNPVNDAPDASGTIADQTSEDAQGITPLDASSFFSDVDGDTLHYSASDLPKGLSIDPNTGIISGTIDHSASQDGSGGVYSVTVTATDDGGLSADQTFTWTVTNPAPVAHDDTVTVNEDMPASGNVLSNDSDPDGDALSVTGFVVAGDATSHSAGDSVTIAGVGTLVLDSDGSYNFTPDANWNGSVPVVTYTVSDGEGGTGTADLVITVNPVADLTATDDTANTDEDTPFTGSVADNDSTTSGGDLTFAKESDPGHGTVIVNSDGSYTYTPDANYNGPDSFTYTVTDPASGESSTQTVNITVNPVADLTAKDDTASTDEETPFTGSVADNDSTTSGGDLTFAKESDPGHGTVVVNSDGSYTYTPDANYNGPDSFTYTVTDPASGESSTQTVNIIVNPVADLTAKDDTASTDEDTPFTGSVADNDSTTSGGDLTFAKESDPGHGTVIVNSDGSYTYTPDANYNGPDSFTYTVTDPASGESSTQTVNITVNPVADLTAGDDTASTDEDTPFTGSVADNDSTTSGGDLTFAKESDPGHGTVIVNSDGSYTYTPDANYNGPDSFTYTVTDPASGESSTQTVNITVNPVADLTAKDDTASTDEDTPFTGSVADNDSTTSGGDLTFAKESDPGHGTVVVNSDGSYTYTPDANYNGPDSFTYTVTDPASGESSTQTVNITVNPVVDLTAGDDTASTDEDTPFTGSVADNDSTTSGGDLTFAKESDPGHGTVIVNSDGSYTYTPDANYNGPDSFTYTVTDPASGESSTQTVNIIVNPVVDLTAADDTASTDEDTPFTGSVADNDSTTSGGDLTFAKESDPGHGTVIVNSDGSYTYTPDANYNGPDSFTYTVTDPASGESSTQTVNITVNPVNDAPVIGGGDASGTVIEAGNLIDGTVNPGTPSVSGTLSATDVDGDPLSWSLSGTPDTTYGTFSIDPATGQWSYALDNSLPATQALNAGDTVTLTYTVEVSDGVGGTDTREVTITLVGTNDAPVANVDTGVVTEAGVLDGGNTATPGVLTATGNVLANDTDVDDGEQATLHVSTVGFGAVTGTVGAELIGTYGSLVLNADGSYTYTLDNNDPDTQALKQGATATEVFSYTTVDIHGTASESTLTITVTGTNDQPVITSDNTAATGDVSEQGTVNPDAPNTVTGTLTASDDDTDATQHWSLDTTNGTYGTIAIDPATGQWTYTLDNARPATQALHSGESETETFTASVTDEFGAHSEQVITVTVHGSNDDITGSGDETVTLAEDGSATGTLQDYVSHVDDVVTLTGFTVDADGDGTPENYAPGDSVALKDASGNAIGTLTIAVDGSYSFTPAPNYAGNVPIVTYTMESGVGGAPEGASSVTQTLQFNTTPVSDAPGLDPDTTVHTNEDTAVSLGLKAPVITDAGTGTDDNDYPERLGGITLTIGGDGASGVTLFTGGTTLTPVGGAVTIVLTDMDHVTGVPPEDNAHGVYYLTTAEYEALEARPLAESGQNFTVTVGATSYEVDSSGAILPGVDGASSTQTVTVDVQAVTDGATLTVNGGATADLTGKEDGGAINLGNLVTTPNNVDGHPDTDGSEHYSYTVSGLPSGAVVTINGTDYTVGASGSVTTPASATFTAEPSISITPPGNFSGDITGVTVTLHTIDTDSDSSGTISPLDSSVTINLYIDPVAGDVAASDVKTPEDTAAHFLAGVTVTDTGGGSTGSEVINQVSFEVPTGWTLTAPSASAGWTYTLSGTTATIAFDNTLSEADRETVLDGFTIKPPAQSSTDATIALSIQSTDSNTVHGQAVSDTQTVERDVKITVTPVAEQVGVDSAGRGGGASDVTMIDDYRYASAGKEDTWFALGTNYTDATNTNGGNDLKSAWSNADPDEFTYAVLSPTLQSDTSGDSVIGTQFRYSTDGGATWQTLTYSGDALWVPAQYLDTLQVMLPPNVSGTLTIGVQAGTVDYDDDADTTTLPLNPPHAGGAGVDVAVSGSATLSFIKFDPVADGVTMALSGRAAGLEDHDIPLTIRTTSVDPSETFDVTITGIPEGAKFVYDGTELAVSGGSVTIDGFSNTAPIAITPPPNSNADFTLTVTAVSVDGTDTSAPVSRTIDVSVKGVADTAVVTLPATPFSTTEAALDSGNHKVALSQVVASVTSPDTDGSETVTLRITGLAEGFSIAGATTVVSGTGEERVWVVSANNLANVSVVMPDNYSGTVNLQVAGVTTENDGDSHTGDPTNVSFTVTPSPESTITTSATLVEDEISPLNLAIVHHNGDTDEVLGKVYVPVNYDTSSYTLYLNGTALPDAGLSHYTDGNGVDYYVIPADQVGELGAKGASNLDGDLGSLTFLYEVTDPSSDGTLPAVTEIETGTLTLTATPVTDPVTASITAINMTGATGTTANNVPSGDHADPDTATVTGSGSVTVNLHVDSGDTDGSEHLIRVLIDGVPDGVTVSGAAQVGTGSWLLVYDGGGALSLGASGVDVPVEFLIGKGAGDGTSAITMTAMAQDEGQSSTTPAGIEADTVGWSLVLNLADGGPSAPPTIDHWSYNGAAGTEDTPFTLGSAIDAGVSTGDSSAAYTYTVTLTDLPAGASVSGMILTTIGGVPVWTATTTVPAGSDSQAALDDLLSHITITPPANSNDNNADFSFDAKLTAAAVGGTSVQADTNADGMHVTPVTDDASITVATTSVGEGTASVSATIAAHDTIDGSDGTIVDGKLYVQVSTAGNDGGTVTDGAGHSLALTTVSGVAGVPDGSYYVVDVGTSGGSVDLTYTAAGNVGLEPGDVTFTAWAQTQEVGASNIASASGTGTAAVEIINNGVTVTSQPEAGSEPASADKADAIQLSGLSVTLNDNDGSETIHSILLTNVPVGFLLYVGDNAGDATLAAQASNAGGDGITNTWVLSNGDGTLPNYVAILPAPHWSGSLTDLALVVESGETSLSTTRVDTVPLGTVTVEAVADGLTINPTLSFGTEGHILDMNLNAAMADPVAATASVADGSTETTTLQITGLGDHAAFYVGDDLVSSVSYDAGTDTYTVTGLSQSDLDDLGFVQAASALTDHDTAANGTQVDVTAWTVESANGDESAHVSGALTLAVTPVLATTGNDSFIWDGNAIDGKAGIDTVALRVGEDLTHTDLAGQLKNIEVIDLSAPGANSITGGLSIADVLKITGSSSGTLTIHGGTDDEVELSSASEWSTTGVVTDGHVTYTSTSGATVLVDEDIYANHHVSYAA